jgi:hypothetical protein
MRVSSKDDGTTMDAVDSNLPRPPPAQKFAAVHCTVLSAVASLSHRSSNYHYYCSPFSLLTQATEIDCDGAGGVLTCTKTMDTVGGGGSYCTTDPRGDFGGQGASRGTPQSPQPAAHCEASSNVITFKSSWVPIKTVLLLLLLLLVWLPSTQMSTPRVACT